MPGECMRGGIEGNSPDSKEALEGINTGVGGSTVIADMLDKEDGRSSGREVTAVDEVGAIVPEDTKKAEGWTRRESSPSCVGGKATGGRLEDTGCEGGGGNWEVTM